MKRLALLLALLVPVTALGQDSGDSDLPPMLREPRKVSGIARPEQSDPPGQITVRAAQGAMKRTEFGDIRATFPEGKPVHLVSIDRKGRVGLVTLPLDDGGRVTFENLATDGSVTYYTLAIFPRQGAEDRLQSRAIIMPPQVGMRLMLAGHGVESGKPPADDILGDDAVGAPAPGEVLVEVNGETQGLEEVELVRIGADEPVARAKVEQATTKIRPTGQARAPEPDAALKDGLVAAVVTRGGKGAEGIAIEVVPADGGEGAAAASPGAVRTDADGRAVIEGLTPGTRYVLRADIHGRLVESAPFQPADKGGTRIEIEASWQEFQSLRARFTGVEHGADQVYIARIIQGGRPFLSPPFQLTAARGAATQVIVFPDLLLAFHGGGQLDDDKLWFQIQFSVINPSLVPHDPGPDGLRIPLPAGFRAASVGDPMSARVKVDEDEGLVWRGAIPSGQHDIVASFFLPTDGGTTELDLTLPLGAFDSQLVLENTPGVRVEAPGLQQQPTRGRDGRRLLVLGDIQKRPGERIQIRIDGLPQHPAWMRWSRIAVGLGVIGLIGWAVWGMVARARRRTRQDELEAEREDLLQALVQLEADHRKKRIGEAVYDKNRRVLTRKLEAIYAELGTGGAGQGGAGGERP